MPPHCDSLDGPVVKAAMRALEAQEVELVLPFVPEGGEGEVRVAFEQVLAVERLGPPAWALAREWFYENVVRIHRAGEGAAYTGLRPAGLDHGPVVPVAERSVEAESSDELVRLLTGLVEEEVRARHGQVMRLKGRADGDLRANREYVEAMLGLEVWAHSLYEALHASPHEGHGHAR